MAFGSGETAPDVVAEEPESVAFEEPALGRLLHAEFDVASAASDDRVLLVGGAQRSEGGLVALHDDVIVVDAATGDQAVVALPTTDPPIALSEVVSDGVGGFVVAAVHCADRARLRRF